MASPSQQSSHPLTDEHYHKLSSCLEGCSLLDELLGKCQSAGLNVDQHVRANNQRKLVANGIKQAFFPDRP